MSNNVQINVQTSVSRFVFNILCSYTANLQQLVGFEKKKNQHTMLPASSLCFSKMKPFPLNLCHSNGAALMTCSWQHIKIF